MKQLTIFIILIVATIAAKAQTGYFIAYGFSTSEKTIYISFVQNVSDYNNCEEEHYHTKLKPKECLVNTLRDALKIEVGRTYYKYDLNTITKKNSNGYGTDEYFSSREEAERKRKEIMGDYSERGYKIIKLEL